MRGGRQRPFSSGDLQALYDQDYPLHALIALEEIDAPFDVLVMDEAQDLFRPGYLDVTDRLIRGGLAGGRWAFFGDFTGQTLYGATTDPDSDLSVHCNSYVRARLTMNCRNPRSIAEAVAMVAGQEPPRTRAGTEKGPEVKARFWRSPAGFRKYLEETVAGHLDGGFDYRDIMVLSRRRLENSVLATVDEIGGARVVDCSRSLEAPAGALRFSTIHSFKGMESRIVIIVDIDEVEADWARSLLYVGMSRARNHLTLMIHDRERLAFQALMRDARQEMEAGRRAGSANPP